MEHVGEPTAPAAPVGCIGARLQPGHALVAVREQLFRYRHRTRFVFGLADRIEQGADIGGDGQRRLRLIEQVAQQRHGRIEPETRATDGDDGWIQRQQACCRQRQGAARGGVLVVFGGTSRHQHVEGVVAAIQIHADQGAVAVAEQLPAAARSSVGEGKLAGETREQCRRGACAKSAPDEVASFHGITVRWRIRGRSGSARWHPARAGDDHRRRRCPCPAHG